MTLLNYLQSKKGYSFYVVLYNTSYKTVSFAGYSWLVPYDYLQYDLVSIDPVTGTDVVVVSYENSRLG